MCHVCDLICPTQVTCINVRGGPRFPRLNLWRPRPWCQLSRGWCTPSASKSSKRQRETTTTLYLFRSLSSADQRIDHPCWNTYLHVPPGTTCTWTPTIAASCSTHFVGTVTCGVPTRMYPCRSVGLRRTRNPKRRSGYTRMVCQSPHRTIHEIPLTRCG